MVTFENNENNEILVWKIIYKKWLNSLYNVEKYEKQNQEYCLFQ